MSSLITLDDDLLVLIWDNSKLKIDESFKFIYIQYGSIYNSRVSMIVSEINICFTKLIEEEIFA